MCAIAVILNNGLYSVISSPTLDEGEVFIHRVLVSLGGLTYRRSETLILLKLLDFNDEYL